MLPVQMITAYQRENQLYCVRAQYVPNDASNLQVRRAWLFRHNSQTTTCVPGSSSR
jgi:hypothetical protein